MGSGYCSDLHFACKETCHLGGESLASGHTQEALKLDLGLWSITDLRILQLSYTASRLIAAFTQTKVAEK